MTTIAAPRSAAASLRHRGAAGGYLHAGAWAAGLAIGWGVLPEAGDGTSEIAAK